MGYCVLLQLSGFRALKYEVEIEIRLSFILASVYIHHAPIGDITWQLSSTNIQKY